MPSLDALYRHWLRSQYTVLLWQQATCESVVMPPYSIYGWIAQEDGSLICDWGSSESLSKLCLSSDYGGF